MEGYLKVTPAALQAKSGEFEQNRAAISSLIEQMNSKVTGMNSNWQGDAATAYLASYNGLKDDVERLNRLIMEYVRDLNEIAEVYIKAEEKAEQTGEGLPRDAIE